MLCTYINTIYLYEFVWSEEARVCVCVCVYIRGHGWGQSNYKKQGGGEMKKRGGRRRESQIVKSKIAVTSV